MPAVFSENVSILNSEMAFVRVSVFSCLSGSKSQPVLASGNVHWLDLALKCGCAGVC